jgi:hypothetical protein
LPDIRAGKHRAVHTDAERRRWYIVPYPDAEVYLSMRLRRDVLLRSGRLDAVVDLVLNDPQWPRPGHLPILRQSKYNPRRPVDWVPVGRTRIG